MDQLYDNNGKFLGHTRYKQLVKECYIISKNTNTSYTDLLTITPTERKYILDFLLEESKRVEDNMKKKKAERETNRNNRR